MSRILLMIAVLLIGGCSPQPCPRPGEDMAAIVYRASIFEVDHASASDQWTRYTVWMRKSDGGLAGYWVTFVRDTVYQVDRMR
jgi:hypothetical protein